MNRRPLDGMGPSAERRRRLSLSEQRKAVVPRRRGDTGSDPVRRADVRSRPHMDSLGRRRVRPEVLATGEELKVAKITRELTAIALPQVATEPFGAKAEKAREAKARPQKVRSQRKPRIGLLRIVGVGIAVVVLGLIVWLAVESVGFGEIAVGVYAVIAWIRRASSRLSFGLALASLAAIVVAQIVSGGENWVGDNLAVLAFLFLCVGTITLAFEVRKSSPSAIAQVK